jgi:pimeloyl-ACP methyl ester carboxylesterase
MDITTKEHEGFTFCFHQIGSGEPVVFLHGFPNSSHVWHRIMEGLSDRYHCIGVDIAGLGGCRPSPDFRFTLSEQGQFVATALDALAIKSPIHLVVHDLGAFPGLAFATDHPERVKSLTIFNADFHADFKWYFWAKVWRIPVIGEIAMHTGNFSIFKSEMRKGSPTFTDEYLRTVYGRLNTKIRNMALKHFRAWNQKELTQYEPAFLEATKDIPKLVIWGKQDPYSASSYAERFGTDNIAWQEKYGHWMMIEDPAFSLQHLSQFLDGLSA